MRFATHKLVLNPENLPSIVLLFGSKPWSSCAAKLLQKIIFQTMMKIRGNGFVPNLCLQGNYNPDLDLNLSKSRSNPITNVLSLCNGSQTPLLTGDTSSEPEGDMTSLEADESDGSGGPLSIAKCPTTLSHSTVLMLKAPVPVVKQVSAKQKKSSVALLYQCSGYSVDESDHTNECSRKKFSKFTLAQRADGIKRRELHHEDSNSESEAKTEDFSGQICMNAEYIIHVCDMDKELMFSFCRDIKLIPQGTSCAIQISDCSFNCSTSDSSVSTQLDHAVKHQCFQLVRNILACDGGEDQVCMMDEDGHTLLEIASQSKDFKIFELLLECLIRSQASPSVTLQQCSSHQLITLLASMIKVLSKLGDIDSSTLHWAMVCCQHWEIPRVLCATSTTVPTMLLPLWSNSKQLSMCRGGSRKKVTNELSVKQEQGIPSWSEMVSVAHKPNGNSLVVDLSLTENKWELNQPTVTTSTAPTLTDSLYQKCSQQPFYETAGPSTSPQIMPNSLKESSTAELVTDECVPEQEPLNMWHAYIENAANCLDAGYYSQMLELLKFGKMPFSFSANVVMATQFGCALAYYKLSEYSEATKHFESLKAIAASTQNSGNEFIASVYLGDIEVIKCRYTKAIEHYSRALKLHKDDICNVGKEYRLIVPTFSAISVKLGSAFRNASKVKDAMHAYRQAIATTNSKKDKLSAHMSLGNLLQSMGDNANALVEYELAIELSEELKDYVSLSLANGNMGIACLGLYRRDKVFYHLQKALDLTLVHEPTPQAIGSAYNNLGAAYQALDELDKAKEYYDLALSQAIYGNDLPGQARGYGNIGNVLMLRKDYERAIPQYTEALHLSRDRSTFFTALCSRGCSYYEWAESKKATLPHIIRSSLDGSDFENCEVEHQPSFESLPNGILEYYQLGRQDLEQVVKYCEEAFENIKGSSEGLTLSVSPFETDSRIFHCLQNCLFNLGEWEKALVVAEQNRTRALGELLVKKKGSTINHPLAAPLNLQDITYIVQSQPSVIVYLSYTGTRLLGWVLAPTSDDKPSVDMFEVPLEDDRCEGKSFDYNFRNGLTEELVERNFESLGAVDYTSYVNKPVRNLYKLIGKPLIEVLNGLKTPHSTSGVHKIVIIPDSYTNLPFSCLLEETKFLGDNYSFRIMPSLLTMGIVNQLSSVVVQMPADSQNMCVVGNPTIPSFTYKGDEWSLRELPFATQQAECVANILKTAPILHKQATKAVVLMRITNAKVVHIVTHGSASAGFLAFSGEGSSRNGEAPEANNILLHPEDITKLSISPAFVVLHTYDSGRGTVKANGILDLARAFIFAGTQAVLTTLWSVPDESASVFMLFFYQYLMDKLKASLALHKATLSLRCFSKYSQYIHWGGYELTGREIQFDITKPSAAATLEAKLGKSSVFPRLKVVQQLESAFLKDPHTPSDVQILTGSPGVKPSEPLVDFIYSFYDVFKGGIFWVNGRQQELIDSSVEYIRQATETVPTALQSLPVLVVLDHIDQMPWFSDFSTSLMDLLRCPHTHVVAISKTYAPSDALLREIDHKLLRGCKVIDVKPLSMMHTTQRIVHTILSGHHFVPNDEDQKILEKLAQFASGFPTLIDVITALFLSEIEHDSQNASQDTHDTLVNFNDLLLLDEVGPYTKPVTVVGHEPPKRTASEREMSKNVYNNIDSVRPPDQDSWRTNSPYDSWQPVTTLIDQCSLNAEEKLLLFAVSMCSCTPIPMSVVTAVSSMILQASQKPHISTNLHSRLFQMQLMKRYPLPVILHPSLGVQQPSTEPEIVYVPQHIAQAVWKDTMSPVDKVVALSTMYKALCTLADNQGSTEMGFLKGLSSLLMDMYEFNYELIGKQCYKEVYKLYLRFHTRREEKSEALATQNLM